MLRELIANPYWAEWQVRKAKAVLGIASGQRVCDLAAELKYSPPSIWRTCRRFERDGMSAVVTKQLRAGKPMVNSQASLE
jgi:hypothetical protein